MIAHDFAYYRPESLDELSEALALARPPALFYAGGSEIISMARAGSIRPGSVIDVKAIPELNASSLENGSLTLGAALTLADVSKRGLFPPLSAACARVADHTNQCRITLGGNACGTIIYREALLALLAADARVTLWRGGTFREARLRDAFDGRMLRAPDELVVKFTVDARYLRCPWAYVKRVRAEKIDYPLVSAVALKADEGIRLALSGALDHPFRSDAVDAILSDGSVSVGARVRRAVDALGALQSDVRASGAYRAFVLKTALEEILGRIEGEEP